MAIFDSKKTTYLTYYVVLDDAAEVERLTALYPNGANIAPHAPPPHGTGGAAVQFGAPWQGTTAGGIPPFSYTEWTSGTDRPFPTNVATFERHTGGFFGFLGGTTIRYYWMGKFVYQAPAEPGAGGGPTTVNATTKRRFVQGFETPGHTVTGLLGAYHSTDASRHPGGRGLAIRGLTNSWQRFAVGQYDSSFTGNVTKTWERFYIRLRKLPTADVIFWRTHGYDGSDGIGQALGINASGQITISKSNSSNIYSSVGAVPDVTLAVWTGLSNHDAWYRIDVLIETGPTAQFKVYVDGELKTTIGAIVAAASSRHTGSSMGAPTGVATSDLWLDVDDWISADWPTTFDGQDWLAGSKVVRLVPRSFAASTGWAGTDFRALAQAASPPTDIPVPVLTSATAGAVVEVTTNADDVIGGDAGSAGVAAMQVNIVGRLASGSVGGQVGYSVAGAVTDPPAVAQSASLASAGVVYSALAGASAPLPTATPITLRYTKAADVVSTQLYAISAQVELVGRWGASDYTPGERETLGSSAPNPSMGAHNYPYPRSPWATRSLAAPIAPYVVVGGTYTGNGTGQDLTFPAAVHWLWIRPATGGSGGVFWLAAGHGAHEAQAQFAEPHVAYAEQDPTFTPGTGDNAQQQQYRVRLAGADTQANAAGITYQYVAVCDPGMRFLLTGSILAKPSSGTTTHPLILGPGWIPEFLQLQVESVDIVSTKRFYGKGSGNAAATLALYGGGTLTTALSLGPGTITTDTGLTSAAPSTAYTFAAWRKTDDSGDTGLPAVVAFGSYTGDGTASRSIPFSPASGKRPLFAIVFPESGAGYQRDPTHTGTNSSTATGTETGTGITAGAIDGFQVGSSLNSNGVIYSWFALMAGATACNNGWGCNGTYTPVEPVPPGTGWPDPPPEPEPDGDGDGDGGGGGGEPPGDFPGGPPIDPPDFSAECAAWSTYLLNVALSRIGVAKQIPDIRTATSEEAYKGRLIYAMDVERTLRDYPWPFATRYSSLTLVGGTAGTPVNADWQYSYRTPVSLVTARRIVGLDGERRRYDLTPEQFRLGSDATGYLIYSNEASTADRPLTLEYTVRLPCPAQAGDPLFRDALAWKLAASLALTIARDSKKALECEAMYQDVLKAAKVAAANEAQPDLDTGDAPWITGR